MKVCVMDRIKKIAKLRGERDREEGDREREKERQTEKRE